MIIVVQKQCRSSPSCPTFVLLKILQNPRIRAPGLKSLLKTLFKSNPAGAFSANPSKPLRTPPVQNIPNNGFKGNLSLNHIFFFSQFLGNLLVYVLISIKKKVVQLKSYFTATEVKDFLDLEPLGYFALFYFFCKKRLLKN